MAKFLSVTSSPPLKFKVLHRGGFDTSRKSTKMRAIATVRFGSGSVVRRVRRDDGGVKWDLLCADVSSNRQQSPDCLALIALLCSAERQIANTIKVLSLLLTRKLAAAISSGCLYLFVR
jgi:hypothetical protein